MQEPQQTGPKAQDKPWALDTHSVRKYLQRIDKNDPGDRTEQLAELLDQLRQSTLSVRERLAALDHCARAAGSTRREVSRSLAGLSLPLSRERDQLSRRHGRTHRLLADCYMEAASDIAASGRAGTTEASHLAHSCYHGIANLGEQLLIHYERYSKLRPGIWLDIHRLYNLAHAEGVSDSPIDSDAEHQPQTVEHIFKRVLLLGLSDPFHHPFRGQSAIYAKLDKWAALASLSTPAGGSNRCLFTIDPALDRPAMPAMSSSKIRPEFDEKWLNTRQLVDHLKQKHHNAAKSTVWDLNQPEHIAQELESIEQLRRMIIHWGIHPVRNAERRSVRQRCDMVIGLKSVCVALNDFEPLATERAEPQTSLVNMIKGRFNHAQRPADDHVRLSRQWEIFDESERGFRVAADAGEDCPGVAVGELVALRTGTSGEWTIGNVHWAQTDDHGVLSLGIKRIGVSARPAAIFRMRTGAGASDACSSALLLESGTEDGRGVSLICDRGLYYPTATYLVRYAKGKSERVLEALNVRLTTRSFVMFDARKPAAVTRERALDLIYSG